MNIIVAADENWAIGCRGDLLVRIPADCPFRAGQTLSSQGIRSTR